MTPDLEVLIQRYLDGSASKAEVALLNERLAADAGARGLFMEMLNLDAALAAQAAGWMAAEPRRAPAYRLAKAAAWLALAACVVIAGIAWWQAAPAVYATVHRGVGAQALVEGMVLHDEVHEISQGTVEFITPRGATVVLEAPALFRFESAQRLHLMRGRVAAEVPPAARGFTVVTPTGDAVDLGTKFGVDVPVQGAAQIHVFQGEVVAKPRGPGRHQSVHGGEAVTLQPAAEGLEFRSGAFIRPDEVNALSAGWTPGQRAHSEAVVTRLRKDADLVALFDFEDSNGLPQGTYRLVQGRWPGSQAAEFVNIGDHMKVDVGGDREWPRLTLAAWVRLDRLGAPYQSLYHTDGWNSSRPGQVHWMINRDTTMRLALQQNAMPPGPVHYPDSRTPVLPEQGRWVHLAVVYDSVARTVRFYLNGELDNEVRQETAFPARLGPAQIGNWNQQDRKLSGRVDDLLILGRALTDDEVRAIHSAGTPYLDASR